jgi:hypothetical protein
MARDSRTLRVVLVLLGLATLGGCVHIPNRAWQNGRYLRSEDFVYAPLNVNSARELKAQATALLMWSDTRPYKPFGTKW